MVARPAWMSTSQRRHMTRVLRRPLDMSSIHGGFSPWPWLVEVLATVRGLGGRGEHLEAFYNCLYYATLWPSEAVMLSETDLHLPNKGWGRIDLAASASRAGTVWTDHGTARQERGLKHRAAHETSTIPTPDGRIFQASRGASSRTRPTAPSGRRQADGPHPRPVQVAAGPPSLRPAARGGVAVLLKIGEERRAVKTVGPS